MPRDLTQDPRFGVHMGLIRDMLEEIREDIGMFDDVFQIGEVEEIECQHRDGFIAFTNGGFSVTGMADFSSARWSGSVPAAVAGMVDQAETDAEEWWAENEGPEFGYDPEEDGSVWGFLDRIEREDREDDENLLPMPLPRHGVPRSDLARESLWSTIDEWLGTGTTYFYKVRAQLYAPDNWRGNGEDEVFFVAAICTDLEYGRDSGDQEVFTETVPLSEITPEKIEQVHTAILSALSRC